MSASLDPNLFRLVLETIPVGLFAVDRDGRIFLWNAGVERITGFLRQEAIGHLCGDTFLEHTDAESNPFPHAGLPLIATLRSSPANWENFRITWLWKGTRMPSPIRQQLPTATGNYPRIALT